MRIRRTCKVQKVNSRRWEASTVFFCVRANNVRLYCLLLLLGFRVVGRYRVSCEREGYKSKQRRRSKLRTIPCASCWWRQQTDAACEWLRLPVGGWNRDGQQTDADCWTNERQRRWLLLFRAETSTRVRQSAASIEIVPDWPSQSLAEPSYLPFKTRLIL